MIKIVCDLTEVIKNNEKMIYKLASSFSEYLKEDLYQVGVIGLINAYKSFNPEFNTKFSTYAYPFILGEMRKYIRENNGIKVNREITYLCSRLDRLVELLCQKYKRMPTTYELSIETNLPEWKIVEALNLRNCVSSLDECFYDGKRSLIDTVSDNKDIDKEVEINEMLSSLDDEERVIINERYINDRSQKEVSDITGYSQAKVSRCEQKILAKLRSSYKTG